MFFVVVVLWVGPVLFFSAGGDGSVGFCVLAVGFVREFCVFFCWCTAKGGGVVFF
jgi:hypothetical protein